MRFLFLTVVLSRFVESGISEDHFFVFPIKRGTITQTLVIPYNKKTRQAGA